MNSEWPDDRIEYTTINAGNLLWLHMGTVQAMQAVDRETATAVVIPGATTREAARILRMIVDGEVNDAAEERARIVAWLSAKGGYFPPGDGSAPRPIKIKPGMLADRIERGEHLEDNDG